MKKMNKKGFTLMEMLIVIAIIAILIAIAIPTFTAALEKSRQKTDLANARALKSLVVAQYMAGDEEQKDKPIDVREELSKSGVTEVTFYLAQNGQELAVNADAGIKVSANWSGSYTKNTPVSCTFNTDCKMVKSVPKLPGES